MKQYKLIKKYPGSPELGAEIKIDPKKQISQESGHWYGRATKEVINFPEHWQEIIEKDYEILSIKSPYGSILIKHAFDFFTSKKCSDQGYQINSIKRLSDNQVFTIGDKITTQAHRHSINYFDKLPTRIIQSFEIVDNTIRIFIDDNYKTLGSVLLKNADSIKKPLFTTEDGIDIFDENTTIYWISTNSKSSWSSYKDIIRLCTSTDPQIKCFSTEEAAEEYIVMNKPCLSLKDLLSIKIDNNDDDEDYTTSFELYRDEVEKLIKSRL